MVDKKIKKKANLYSKKGSIQIIFKRKSLAFTKKLVLWNASQWYLRQGYKQEAGLLNSEASSLSTYNLLCTPCACWVCWNSYVSVLLIHPLCNCENKQP